MGKLKPDKAELENWLKRWRSKAWELLEKNEAQFLLSNYKHNHGHHVSRSSPERMEFLQRMEGVII